MEHKWGERRWKASPGPHHGDAPHSVTRSVEIVNVGQHRSASWAESHLLTGSLHSVFSSRLPFSSITGCRWTSLCCRWPIHDTWRTPWFTIHSSEHKLGVSWHTSSCTRGKALFSFTLSESLGEDNGSREPGLKCIFFFFFFFFFFFQNNGLLLCLFF